MRHISGALAAILAGVFGLGAASVAQAQNVSPSTAPIAWVRYADAATAAITGWLEEESATTARFRAYFVQTHASEDLATSILELKVWIDGQGAVSRLDFTPFADAQANEDLRAAIVGRHMVSEPPGDMLLPLRIAVQIEPAPAGETPSH